MSLLILRSTAQNQINFGFNKINRIIGNEYRPSTTFDYYIGPSGSDSNAGTLASPWAITALWTKASTYAGKRLGLLDGTYHGYNGTLYNSTYDAAYYIPSAAAGTASVRTVIGGVNPRGAVLVGDGGSLSGWTRAKTGLWCVANYVTVQDLSIREAGVFGVLCTATSPYLFGNEIQRVDRVTYGDGGYDNQCGIHTAVSAHNGWIAHNYVHDIVAGGSGYNESCIQLYHCQNAIVEYNECTDANTGIFLKEDCGGSRVRLNYVHGCAQALYYGTNDAFAATWNNNVVTDWADYLYRRDNLAEAAGTKFYNNTFIVSAAGDTGLWVRATSGNPVDAYNNLLVRQGGSSSSGGDMVAGGSGAFGIADYNLYGTTVTFGVPDYTPVADFAAYKTAIGSKEAHSINVNPTFASGGTGPYAYRLAIGSNGENDGSSDGTTGGSAVNIGAFVSSGQTEQIGPDWRWPVAEYPNEPAGLITPPTITTPGPNPFDIKPRYYDAADGRAWYDLDDYGWCLEEGDTVNNCYIYADPVRGNVLRSKFPAGLSGGNTPYTTMMGFGHGDELTNYGNYTKLFVGFWVKLSSNWIDENLGTKLVFFFSKPSGSSAGSDGSWNINLTDRGTPYLRGGILEEHAGVGNVSIWESGVEDRGVWVKYEYYIELNTPGTADGVLKVWRNGLLTLNVSNAEMINATRNLSWAKMSMTYGGGSTPVPEDMYIDLDNWYIKVGV